MTDLSLDDKIALLGGDGLWDTAAVGDVPRLHVAESVLVPPAGHAIVSTIRWAMGARR